MSGTKDMSRRFPRHTRFIKHAGAVLALTLVAATAPALAQEPAPTGPSQANPFRDLSDKKVLVITPHPDDDITGCGGALAFLSGRHNRMTVVFLTTGENGSFDPTARPETIRRVRMREARAAYNSLGFPDAELIWFGYPDGELDFAPQREIRMKLVRLIRKYKPDAVFALDPGATYYRYHYRDHRSAALVSADAIGAAMWPLEHRELGPAHRVPDVYYFYTSEPNLKVDISEVYEKKLDALAQHRSQFPPAVNHFTRHGPAPSRTELEASIRESTGGTTFELFRRR